MYGAAFPMHPRLVLSLSLHIQRPYGSHCVVLLLGACCVVLLHVALVSSAANCRCDRMLPPNLMTAKDVMGYCWQLLISKLPHEKYCYG